MGKKEWTVVFWGLYFLLLQFMIRFEGKGEDCAQSFANTLRTLDVILLRDNREASKEGRLGPNFRGSAFKETEADPLEDRNSEVAHNQEVIEDLLQRVAKLEQRVQMLEEHRDSLTQSAPSGRKRRRRFEQMQRDIQCTACQKSYGSETALKYHYKLKHGGQPQ